MRIRWSDWDRLGIFLSFLACLVLAIAFWAMGETEARASLQASYAFNPHDFCHALSPDNAANYVAEQLAEMTGEAVSPLLSLTLVGGFKNFCTDEQYKELLPWYYRSSFLGFTFILLLLLTFKDTLVAPFGILKKPFDALGEFVHIISGIIALPIAVVNFSDSVANPIAQNIEVINNWLVPSVYAADNSFLINSSEVLLFVGQTIGISLGLILFSSIWVFGNIFEVLIFVSPIPFVDTILSGTRSSFTGILMLFSYINPILGGILASIVLFLSFWMFGWSFRLLTLGIVYCTDFLPVKRRNFNIDARGILAFSGIGVPQTKTNFLGRIYPGDKSLIFVYYPYLIFPKKYISISTVSSDRETSVFRAFLAPNVSSVDSRSEKKVTLFRLPPRYCNRETSVATYLQLPFNQRATIHREGGLLAWLKTVLS